MRNLKAVIIITLAILNSYLQAQECTAPKISFEVTEHDFGKILENNGLVTYRFNFTNTGKFPLIINNVNVTCGCSTSGWSKEPIAPGAKGYVDASFNPKGRPGKFTRTYTVLSNADNTEFPLKLTGEVISANIVPEGAANIKFESTTYEFNVKEGVQVKYVYAFENTGTTNLEIKSAKANCDCVKVELKNSTVAPGKKGELLAFFTTKNEVGFHDVIIDVNSNATNNENIKLKFTGNVLK